MSRVPVKLSRLQPTEYAVILAILVSVILAGCHASVQPRLTDRDLRAYCAVQAYRVGNGASIRAIPQNGVTLVRRGSVLTCSTIRVGY